MPSITQKTINYLGGVSKQPDVQKLPGQVRDAINAYPDLTFGLIKRPGTKLVSIIGSGNQYSNAKWFDIVRDGKEGYVGCILNGDIKIWNIETGAQATVTYGAGSQDYLKTNYRNLDMLTVQDTTIVTNKTVVVKAQPDNFPPASTNGEVKEATLGITAAEYSSNYSLIINGANVALPTLQPTRWGEKGPEDAKYDSSTGAQTTPPQDPSTYFKAFISIEEILKVYETAIKGALPSATVTRLPNTIEVKSSTGFTMEAKGGQNNLDAKIITNRADNISQLPAESVHGRVVFVANSANTDKDDYYVKYIADNGTSGKGYWEETLKPGASPGLDAPTMPHQLLNTAPGVFKFEAIDWEPRLVGDDETNGHPSFVGQTIQQCLFYSNRLTMLTDDNVVMSVAGEYFNFYNSTALTQTAADPVDLSVSSIRPGVLHGAIPVPQGLALFSDRQQFLMQGVQGVISPSTVTIKTISNYEMDDYIDPVEMGTEIIFLSKTPSYTRVLSMVTKGQDERPLVMDIGRIVADWIPKDVDLMISSPQNEFFTLNDRNSRDVYMFRSYREGSDDDALLSSWVRWRMAGTVNYSFVSKDQMYFVLLKDSQYHLCVADLNQSTAENLMVTDTGLKVDPRLDLWSKVSSSNIIYDRVTRTSKVYVPYQTTMEITPLVVSAPSSTHISRNGYYTKVVSIGSDSKGTYFTVNGDLSQQDAFVGFVYTLDVELPTAYYQAENGSDFTATLTVARYKFAVGFSGELDFKIRAGGSSEWLDRHPTKETNYYNADVNPIKNYSMFTLPIHQRSENFNVRVVSETPFPTSLISMSWEGSYSPRYYRRS